jgi:excisionase family DNA binding protein
MNLDISDLFTIEQAAQYLKVSQSSIRSYIRQGKMDAYRVAGKRKVLIPRAELMRLLVPARPVNSIAGKVGN